MATEDGRMELSTADQLDRLPGRVEALEATAAALPTTYQTLTAAAAQNEMIVELIDHGAKNLVWTVRGTETINGVTLTVNDDLSVTLSTVSGSPCSGYFSFRIVGDQTTPAYASDEPIERGKYILTGLPASASATTVRYLLGIIPSSSGTRTSESVYADKVFDIENDTSRFDLAIYVATNADFSTPVTVKPMLCKKKYYDFTQKYIPGSPPNAELFKMLRDMQNGGTRSMSLMRSAQGGQEDALDDEVETEVEER